MNNYKHYIEIDKDNYITKAFSDGLEQPTGGSICVAENAGRHFNLTIRNTEGLCKQWLDNQIVDAPPPIANLKAKKIQELEACHYSDEVRSLKVNGCVLRITSEGRDLIAEQIKNLEAQIKLGDLDHRSAIFTYYCGNTTVDITLEQLQRIYILAMQLVNANFKTYQEHIKKINNLRSRNSIENYDFKTNYKINQEITL